ncbi:cytochrome P450 [Streptomyces sp. TRM 70361]|uniref:cytochrome P450 n=1 Tax=Streptomyces sp. TRM 70361 TaxID=3116553 RepID=UPI002E7BC421|nr:cytochrome P450 [Streptomyces sp. TRM 70361]MEE1942122.1 cytochrome P450 [Streptomyces sp. TRM 70361]
MQQHPGAPEPPPGCPAHGRVPLYTAEFGADPESYYAHLRRFGASAPVELAPGVEAELVTSYPAALQILQNPGTFVRDSRRWRALREGRVPADSPALPMMAYRPNALFSDGAEHARLRQAVTDSLATVDPHRLSRHVERVADYLIDRFADRPGGRADLVADYAQQLPLLVYSELFGCPADVGDRVIFGISGIFEGIDAERANEVLGTALHELVALKRKAPGDDVTSRLMEHPAGLSDDELVNQLVTLLSGGTAPLMSLISTGAALMLGDEKYSGTQYSTGLLVEDAVNEVLWRFAPIANYAVHYPVQDAELDGRVLETDQPVVISFAAANTDPVLSDNSSSLRGKAHLAFGAGPHVCPAKDPAILIGVAAIERLLNRMTDVDLAVAFEDLMWQPTPWSRTLTALPVRFTPVSPPRRPSAAIGQGAGPASAGRQHPQQARTNRWSTFLSWLKGM